MTYQWVISHFNADLVRSGMIATRTGAIAAPVATHLPHTYKYLGYVPKPVRGILIIMSQTVVEQSYL